MMMTFHMYLIKGLLILIAKPELKKKICKINRTTEFSPQKGSGAKLFDEEEGTRQMHVTEIPLLSEFKFKQ